MTAYSEDTKGRRHITESAFCSSASNIYYLGEWTVKQCVHPCPRLLTGGDTHQLCVRCLGAQHARAALEGAACVDCEALPIRVLRSRLAVFDAARLARPAVRDLRPPRRRGGLDRGARRCIC